MELAAQNHILYNVLMSQSVAISLSGKKLGGGGGARAPGAPTVPTPRLWRVADRVNSRVQKVNRKLANERSILYGDKTCYHG